MTVVPSVAVISTVCTRSLPCTLLIWALAMTSTDDACSCSTVCARAERGPAVHQGHAEGDGLQAQRPVAGTVTAADHHDVLTGVVSQRRHEECQPAPDPLVAGGQRPRGEGTDAAGDDDGLRPDRGSLVGANLDRAIVVPGQLLGTLVKHVGRREASRLLDQAGHQVTSLDRREAGD